MITAGGLHIGRKRLHTHERPAVSSQFAGQDFRNSGSEVAAQSWSKCSPPRPGFSSPLTPLQGMQLTGQRESSQSWEKKISKVNDCCTSAILGLTLIVMVVVGYRSEILFPQ